MVVVHLLKTHCLLMRILNKKTAKQTCASRLDSTCGSRTQTIERNKNTLNSLTAAVHKNKRDVAGNKEKVVHTWVRQSWFHFAPTAFWTRLCTCVLPLKCSDFDASRATKWLSSPEQSGNSSPRPVARFKVWGRQDKF